MYIYRSRDLPSISMPLNLLMMRLSNIQTTLILWLLLLFILKGTSEAKRLANSSVPQETKNGTLSSPWLRKTGKGDWDPRGGDGCSKRPWICRRRESPPSRMRCCRNRCVDVNSDVNHCGLCAIRCPYSWACCRGLCRDINFNRFHCGGCFKKCPFGVRCMYGMCGYGEPTPSFPPRPPRPMPSRPPSPQPCEPSDPRHPPPKKCPSKPPQGHHPGL